MKKISLIFIMAVLILFSGINAVYAEITPDDYRGVIKITKKLKKLSDKNDIEGISKYYSDNYISFDGYNKKEMLNIFDTANKLYPNTKTKEKITKVETKDGLIKVFITEDSKTKIDVSGEDTIYANKKRIKGVMNSSADYAMVYKKEETGWKVIKDEIYKETTEIKYGEAIKAGFVMVVPEKITPGKEYTVKTILDVPSNRFAVGSIGHDKIVFPPEKYFDPYRAINRTGILERIMIANKEGMNEYVNSTFAFIAPYNGGDDKDSQKAAISGMGIYVKRINISKEVL